MTAIEQTPAPAAHPTVLEKEKTLEILLRLYRVKKRPTEDDKRLAKQIKSLQHGYDSLVDICVFCKRLMSIDILQIHHPGTDVSSYRLEDIESACPHCNNVENGKKGSTHAAPSSSQPSLRPRERIRPIAQVQAQDDDITREQVLVKQSPITFQKRREWEPLVREYLWRYIGGDDAKPFDVVMKEAAEFSGASHQAAAKYIESACTALGPFRHTDNDIVCRRNEWKPGKTAMSELDLKILQKIADANKAEAQNKTKELQRVTEEHQSMMENLQRVAKERDLLANQVPLSPDVQLLVKERDEAIAKVKAMEEMIMKSRGLSTAKKDSSFIQ